MSVGDAQFNGWHLLRVWMMVTTYTYGREKNACIIDGSESQRGGNLLNHCHRLSGYRCNVERRVLVNADRLRGHESHPARRRDSVENLLSWVAVEPFTYTSRVKDYERMEEESRRHLVAKKIGEKGKWQQCRIC